MDVLHSCRCCLRGASDKDLTMPYTYLGKTEIYANMLKECFDFHVMLVDEASRGICWTCVDRLRDACHFKLQVKRSEAELQKALLVKVEPPVLPEMLDAGTGDVCTVVLSDEETIEHAEMDDENEAEEVLDEDTIENAEMDDKNEPEEVLDEDPLQQSEAEDDVMSVSDSSIAAAAELEQPEPTHAKQQHPTNCPERLVRLRGDDIQSEGQPYACEECDRIFENMSALTTHIQLTHSSTLSKEEYSQNYQPQRSHQEKSLKCSTSLENYRVIHSEVKKLLKCSKCDYKSVRKSHFQRHQMIHTGEKPYSCSYCDLKYSRKELLEKHLKTKHCANYCPFKCNEK